MAVYGSLRGAFLGSDVIFAQHAIPACFLCHPYISFTSTYSNQLFVYSLYMLHDMISNELKV